MRGVPGLLYETSQLHPTEGIKYGKYSLYNIRDLGAKAHIGGQVLPEAVLWLLYTGDFPTDVQLKDLQEDLFNRSILTPEEEQ